MGRQRRKNNPRLQGALDLASMGFRVFPVPENGKKPSLKRWPEQATLNSRAIRDWWRASPNANVAIACGLESNLFVIDVDVKNGKEGLRSLEELEERFGPFHTMKVRTPSEGFHLYFAAPRSNPLKNSTELLPGIDIKTERGCVIAPPSVIDSRPYKWIGDCDTRQALPEGLLEHLSAQSGTASRGSGAQGEACGLTGAHQGRRNDSAFQYARSLREKGNSKEEALVLVLEMAKKCTPPLEAGEASRTVESAFKGFRKEQSTQVQAIDANDLATSDIEEPDWIVDDFLPPGLTILAGRPKSGKSWLALSLSMQVANGGSFLGRDIERGGVMHLALEDRDYRLKERMAILGGRPPKGSLYFYTQWQENDFNTLREEARKIDNLTLIIIDTFGRFRNTAKANSDVFGKDYKEVAKLKSIADELGIAVVVIHHTRKAKSSDPLMTVNGTGGITAAADTICVLEPKPNGNLATLHIQGRDVEDQSIEMEFDSGKWGVAHYQGVRPTRNERRILDVMSATPQSPADISKRCSGNKGGVSKALQRMHTKGLVTRAGHGEYALADEG